MPLPSSPLGAAATAALAGPKATPEAKARKTAQDFEQMFLENALDRMFTNVGEDGPLGENGAGGAVYKSMLVKEYAGNIVKTGGVGISGQIYAELMRLQEGAHATRP